MSYIIIVSRSKGACYYAYQSVVLHKAYEYSWRITAVIRAYHGRDTRVSWARYERITAVIRQHHAHDTLKQYAYTNYNMLIINEKASILSRVQNELQISLPTNVANIALLALPLGKGKVSNLSAIHRQ